MRPIAKGYEDIFWESRYIIDWFRVRFSLPDNWTVVTHIKRSIDQQIIINLEFVVRILFM